MLLSALLIAAQLSVHIFPYGFQTHKPTIRATVRVERDERNRALAVEVKSENYYTISEKTLDGDHAPIVHLFTFKSLPEGEYEVWAIVAYLDGNEWKTRQAKAENLIVN